ncbi:MAG: hypothetical protein GTO53_14105 [Planctomycetales bacterium]|nr:hypothetical protein [Planctomycetales bacterium]NIM10221.1 hypothetical protein [Planctomycetales bacterium]NIN09637.1 hypothetical protein [Planctomycetales bacterium]NIN78693.1 hypothetical protein [Planctomycetales bacterium]NIO35938.1 hypothetical protein [Planctomycetales bacterium]
MSPRFPICRFSGPARDRRGLAVVIVLGVISLALAVSYAMMRSQTTTMLLQHNAARRSAARQAAHAGLSAALQMMHTTSWAGVGTTLEGQLSNTDSYQVQFVAGDTTITKTHPDWQEYPYRVTLFSTGYSADPAHPSARAVHRAMAVVQLVRRQLSPAVAGWGDVQNHTIFQWQSAKTYLEIPFRAEGPVHLQGPLQFFDDYPYPGRPFDGGIDEVALYSRVFSAGELQAIYDAALLPSDEVQDNMANIYASYGPIAWWRLNEAAEATTAVDQMKRHQGTYQGAVAGSDGVPGDYRGAAFDGLNDYVDLGQIDLSGSSMTILAWFRADDFDYADGRIISKATSPAVADHFWMLGTTESSGQIRLQFLLKTGGTTTELIASSGELQPGEWVFAAAVYDGSSMKLYQNGGLVGETSKLGTITTDPLVPVYLGDNPPGSTRARYFRDLSAMQQAGTGDYRTFEGPVDLPRSPTDAAVLSLLEDDQKIGINDIPVHNTPPFDPPDMVPTYQLYAGGPVYSATEIPASSLAGVSFTPDMQTNPLGFFYSNGELLLYDDVTIQGTLMGAGGNVDLRIAGTKVHISPAYIPPLLNASSAVELPSALVSDDLRLESGAEAVLRGMVTVWDEFEIKMGSQTTACDFEGRLATGALRVRSRYEWQQTETWWLSRANDFLAAVANNSPLAYFPQFVEAQQGLLVEPRLQIKPATQPVTYHWQDWSNPLFVPHPKDKALRWDLVQWVDDL